MLIRTFNKSTAFINSTTNFTLKLKPKSIALSGGKTPQAIYKNLGKKLGSKIKKLKFYQVDERYVSQNHPDSNYKMVIETLFKDSLSHIKNFPKSSHPKNFHFFDTSLSIEKSLKKYSKELPKKFDLCILGIGEDGHIASLFPNSKALKFKDKAAHTKTKKFTIKDRLTLTFGPILNSKNLIILLQNKPNVLMELKKSKKPFTSFPALKLLKHKNLVIHYLKTI